MACRSTLILLDGLFHYQCAGLSPPLESNRTQPMESNRRPSRLKSNRNSLPSFFVVLCEDFVVVLCEEPPRVPQKQQSLGPTDMEGQVFWLSCYVATFNDF
mmetsp:Transcript_75773/g.153721  ORF Transcript_75773/g.153721 Transcript_75773/m.153721 type:complete len:101 (+) Transcript_75773:639-941(+)